MKLLFLLFIGLVTAANAGAQSPAQSAPPRSIDDVLKVLEHYKPDPKAAQQAREAAERQPPDTTDAADLAKFYLGRGRAAQRIGRVGQEIEDLRLAFKYSQALDISDRLTAAGALSQAEVAGGNFANAIEVRKTQAGISTRSGDQLVVMSVLTNFYAALGDIPAARAALAQTEAAYQDALRFPKIAATLGSFWLARVEIARGALANAEGKYAEAEASFRKGVAAADMDLRERKTDSVDLQQITPLVSFTRLHAASLAALERHGEAELVMRNALRIALERSGRDSANVGGIVGALAELLFVQGRGREGVLLTKESIAILERAGSMPESDAIVRARRNLGRSFARQNQWAEANAQFELMHQGLQRNALLQQKLSVGDLSWALTLVRLGAPEKAIPVLNQMLEQENARFGAGSFQVAEVRGFLGIALAAAGQRDAALQSFRDAVPVLVERIDEQSGRAGSGSRTWRVTQVLEVYIQLLLDSGGSPPTVDALNESFRLADLARGGRVQLALNASAARASIGDPQLAELARNEQDAEQRLAALNQLLTNMLSAPPAQQLPKVTEELRKEMDKLRTERARTIAEIDKRFPDYANLLRPKPPTLDQVRASLGEGEALVAMYVAAERTYVWAVPKSGQPAVAVVPLGDAAITGIVTSLRRSLDPNATTIDDIPKFDISAASALYTALLKPVESGWGSAKSVLIVPHLALGQLPFALLPTGETPAAGKEALPFEGYRQVPWLARRAAITQLPSVNTLITLRRTPIGSATRRAYAGFGDPFFSTAQAKETIAALSDESLGTRGIRLRNKPKLEGFDSAQLAQLPRLPDTRAEILDVAQVMRADVTQDVFLGERATFQAVKNGSLGNRKVIHFATHGLVPGELDGLMQPALAMTTPALVGAAGGDGLLKMEDILSLKLNADWVVLSACNTASADGSGNAEAVSGLGRAFFYAGARALLVSNWPVDSASARKLMTELFRRQVADVSISRAEALRQAMLHLIDAGVYADAKDTPQYSYAHPLFWAPFSLVGDGGGR